MQRPFIKKSVNQASDGGNDNNSGGESFDETELKSTLEAISKDENLLPALKWLKTCLNDEKEDREEDDENIADMPLVIFEMHKKAYEHIWLHFFCFFGFWGFFPLFPPWKLWKKSSVSSDLNVSFKPPQNKKHLLRVSLKSVENWKKRQPNVLIGLFMHFPF